MFELLARAGSGDSPLRFGMNLTPTSDLIDLEWQRERIWNVDALGVRQCFHFNRGWRGHFNNEKLGRRKLDLGKRIEDEKDVEDGQFLHRRACTH